MPLFTIDAENNIEVHNQTPKMRDGAQAFDSAKELEKVSTDWPTARFIEIWNSFASVAPFAELRPVKRFTSRAIAVARIWSAILRLSPEFAEIFNANPSLRKPSKKSKSKPSEGNRNKKTGSEASSNKKETVIALMRRPKGATLTEIMEVTSWQKHTIRGFVSTLGNTGGRTIESLKNALGERTYRISR